MKGLTSLDCECGVSVGNTPVCILQIIENGARLQSKLEGLEARNHK